MNFEKINQKKVKPEDKKIKINPKTTSQPKPNTKGAINRLKMKRTHPR